LRVGIDVIGDAIFADATLGLLPAMGEFIGTEGLYMVDKRGPVGARIDAVRRELVIAGSVGQ
jgi:hypothetical protein